MLYRIVDSEGIFLRDGFTVVTGETGLDVPPSSGFYIPKWNSDHWEEGATQTQINDILNNNVLVIRAATSDDEVIIENAISLATIIIDAEADELIRTMEVI